MGTAETGWIGRPLARASLDIFTEGLWQLAAGMHGSYHAPCQAVGVEYLSATALHRAVGGEPYGGAQRNPHARRVQEPADIIAAAADQLDHRSFILPRTVAWEHAEGGNISLIVDQDPAEGSLRQEVRWIRQQFDPDYEAAAERLDGERPAGFAIPLGRFVLPSTPEGLKTTLMNRCSPLRFAAAVLLDRLQHVQPGPPQDGRLPGNP